MRSCSILIAILPACVTTCFSPMETVLFQGTHQYVWIHVLFFLSYPILSYAILSYPILLYPTLPYPSYIIIIIACCQNLSAECYITWLKTVTYSIHTFSTIILFSRECSPENINSQIPITLTNLYFKKVRIVSQNREWVLTFLKLQEDSTRQKVALGVGAGLQLASPQPFLWPENPSW